MRSWTVEYQRFGDSTGVIRLSDRYIRTLGTTAPAEEVGFGLAQENLDKGLDALDYANFERAAGNLEGVRARAESVLKQITPHLETFLIGPDLPMAADGPTQLEVVSRAQELAQLPFEILEESHPELIITRRIRQPWPLPEVVRDNRPKVLFVWAEPKRRVRSRPMVVPHARHRELLAELLSDWGGQALVEVGNATRRKLAEALAKNHFTHVHLLAHGIGPEPQNVSAGGLIDLAQPPPPATFVALETDEGTIDRCPPDELERLFSNGPRPETFAVATCHSAELDPIRSGGTLAHVLHAAGIPIVLASQLALTQDGSDELIDTFLRRVIEGADPREALRACRDRLRETQQKTYYDRVALVGYIHVDDGLDERLKDRRFKVALARLKAASGDAEGRVGRAVLVLQDAKGLTAEQRAEAEAIRARFESVRDKLDELEPDRTLTKAQREELRGLRASSLKREAEASWKLAGVLSAEPAGEWLEHSRATLREAAEAYRSAAEISRDHHWTWVQWLALVAVDSGSLRDHEEDWIVARAAARDAVARQPLPDADARERDDIAAQAVWAWGSLCELYLLAPLAGRGDALAEAKASLDELARGARVRGDGFPISATLAQLQRYTTWWGADSNWKLPAAVVKQARQLYDYLKAISEAH